MVTNLQAALEFFLIIQELNGEILMYLKLNTAALVFLNGLRVIVSISFEDVLGTIFF